MSKSIRKHGTGPTGLRRLQAVVFVIACAGFGYALVSVRGSTSAVDSESAVPQPVANAPAEDYSKFQHTNPMHSRLPCLLCHKRAEGLTTPKMPGHMPCAGCHVQQFSDNTSPMCIICHLPGSAAAKHFPPLRSFNIQFDHASHLRQTNCATCHRTSRRGVAFSVPSGAAAHITCFKCHGPQTMVGDRNIGSCSTCHQIGRPVRGSDQARAFAFNFDHREHISKGNMNCAACHTVRAGMARGRQVSAPAASMHFPPAGTMSCGGCHNSKRAFGISDFTNCKRCHQSGSFKF